MRIIYIDLQNSGISGDMFLAVLLDLTPEPDKILKDLEKLKNILPGVSKLEIKLLKTEINGIQINKLKIDIKETKDHRTATILQKSLDDYLANSNISDSAKEYANKVLESLVLAEAEVHGELTKNIHLHELSSVDTLIDVIGVTTALDEINVFNNENLRIYCSKLPLGGGTITTQHGVLAVPAPATLKILEKSNLITYGGPINSELTTPTGAALLASLEPQVNFYFPDMKILKTNYSTGQTKFEKFSNVLRLFYGEDKGFQVSNITHPLQKYVEQVSILETDVDDISGEILGNFISTLAKEHILDIQILPSTTKKNRTGQVIKVICHPEFTFKIIEKIIKELGTLGVRFNIINRVCIDRKIENKSIDINGKNFEIDYKVSFIESEKGIQIINIKPEYEDLKKISDDTGIPVKKIQLLADVKLKQIYDDIDLI
ncbi:MAG: nickel pincer cofactor biosynthesis protein LarC [Promethearchaeota archaeon]